MYATKYHRPKLSDSDHMQLLERLDVQEKSLKTKPRRVHARLEYRVLDIPLAATHPGGGSAIFLAAGRNISCGGISMLVPAFLHLGTECRLALKDREGLAKTLLGFVVFCRHIAGNLHEIGVRFNQKIEPAEFCGTSLKATSDDADTRSRNEPVSGPALVLSAAQADRTIMSSMLKQSGLSPTVATNVGAAIDQIKLLNYVLIACDLTSPAINARELVTAAAASGFAGAIVGIVRAGITEDLDRARDAGITATISKPFQHAAVHATVRNALLECGRASGGPSRIYSTLDSDPQTTAHVAAFISQAHEAAAAIRGALGRGNADQARRAIQTIRSIAGGYGFPQLVEAARQAVEALEPPRTPADAAPKVLVLLDVCARLSVSQPASQQAA